jgi:hypothetical protein
MTQEEIQRRNELIASMLFGIYSEIANAWGFGNARIEPNEIKFGNRIIKGAVWAERFEKELKFHSTWDGWLMDAVNFIEGIHSSKHKRFGVHIIGNNCCIQSTSFEDNLPTFMLNQYGINKLEATFIAVSDFAKIINDEIINTNVYINNKNDGKE